MRQTSGNGVQVTGEGQTVTAENKMSPTPNQPYEDRENSYTSTHRNTNTQKRHTKVKSVAQLIGNRCMVSCLCNGVTVEKFLVNGAQSSIVGRAWVENALPGVEIQPLETLLTEEI